VAFIVAGAFKAGQGLIRSARRAMFNAAACLLAFSHPMGISLCG
jgi:hypothetical protein